MRKLLIITVVVLALGAGFYGFILYNPQNADQETMNESWAQFAAEIAALGELVESAPFNTDERTAAAGYRHMARYISTTIAKFTDHQDPDYPLFVRMPNSVARIGWDNPDNPYLSAAVRGDHSYRIRGDVGGFDLVSFNVYSGMIGYTPMNEMRTISGTTSEDMEIAADGSFELILSAQPHEGNWVRLEPDANNVVIRRLVSDWENAETNHWEIVNLTTLGQSAPEPGPREVSGQLRESIKMARGIRQVLTIAHRVLFQLKQNPNEVPIPAVGDPALPMSDPFQATTRAYFKLADDEALLIVVPQVPCKFTNIQLANPWMESLDYASRQSSLNNHFSHVDDDGKIRYVISKQDPGVANWLDTAGWPEGSLFARWTYCEAYPLELESRVVELSELHELLPANSPRVGATQRAATIAMRQAAVSRRYTGG